MRDGDGDRDGGHVYVRLVNLKAFLHCFMASTRTGGLVFVCGACQNGVCLCIWSAPGACLTVHAVRLFSSRNYIQFLVLSQSHSDFGTLWFTCT